MSQHPTGSVAGRRALLAAGTALDGTPMVVVCSTGVDVDLIPTAADARARLAGGRPGEWRLAVVVPEGDDYPVTRSLAAALNDPAAVLTVGRDWPALTGPA